MDKTVSEDETIYLINVPMIPKEGVNLRRSTTID
jgi:hypothetical protein